MSQSEPIPGLVLSVPILSKMRKIQGWLKDEEADLLISACSRALSLLPAGSAVVEIGSFCGRSTVVLGSVVQSLGTQTKVYAVDPHDGVVGALDSGTQSLGPTLEAFRRNIAENALTSVVEVVINRSFEVAWEKSIAFLFIDGLHDYRSVSIDFRHFEPWVIAGGYIAFHDYADNFPGVKILVDEILMLPQFERVHCAGKMMVIRKISAAGATEGDASSTTMVAGTSSDIRVRASTEIICTPLVSCIMPTADRHALVFPSLRNHSRQPTARELHRRGALDRELTALASVIPIEAR